MGWSQRTMQMGDSLYETDFLTWTHRQAEALRRLPARADNAGLDLENLIEEVETLGRSEVDKVESALFRLMEHAALVALAESDSRDQRHWAAEMAAFRLNAGRAYRPSMRQLLVSVLPALWATARYVAARKLGHDPSVLPEALPFTLRQLLRDLPLEDLSRALVTP